VSQSNTGQAQAAETLTQETRTHNPEMATAIGEFIDYHLDR